MEYVVEWCPHTFRDRGSSPASTCLPYWDVPCMFIVFFFPRYSNIRELVPIMGVGLCAAPWIRCHPTFLLCRSLSFWRRLQAQCSPALGNQRGRWIDHIYGCWMWCLTSGSVVARIDVAVLCKLKFLTMSNVSFPRYLFPQWHFIK